MVYEEDNDDEKDISLHSNELTLAEKISRAKIKLLEERKRRREKKCIGLRQADRKVGETVSHSVDKSEAAGMLFSNDTGVSVAVPNEALEKAKVALAAIERETQHALNSSTSSLSSGQQTYSVWMPDNVAGFEQAATIQTAAVAAHQAQFMQWQFQLPENSMGSDQAAAVQTAAVAAHQAQFMQQWEFQQQYRQHEQKNSQPGNVSGVPSRFQDGYMPLFLCKKLMTFGQCPRGDSCTFAHNIEELHPASPDLPKLEVMSVPGVLSEQAQEIDQMPDVKMKRKRSMCQRYAKGECLLGKQCPFAHKEEDLGTIELVLCGNVKTRICKMWTIGKCIYAVNCWDAHGQKDIGLKRPPPELCPKIKRVRKDE
jgi:hypothetical protein